MKESKRYPVFPWVTMAGNNGDKPLTGPILKLSCFFFFVPRHLINNFRVKPVHKPSMFLAESPHIHSLQERAVRKCLNPNSNGSSADGGRTCNLAQGFPFPLCLTLTIGLFLVLWEFYSIMVFPLLPLLAKFISPSFPN